MWLRQGQGGASHLFGPGLARSRCVIGSSHSSKKPVQELGLPTQIQRNDVTPDYIPRFGIDNGHSKGVGR
ncbi:hypothetical protein Pcinc_027692 [Petrolisthes cinctipes]|uniref:Uncharacterized protein n=1 Tax=Petrolisthes cinctipes TaxID=88211 RepID=A0AAE1K8E6_PETCI|nr:hypothetical protein Pcinc_027692 [Petrolisthes cinctipes]